MVAERSVCRDVFVRAGTVLAIVVLVLTSLACRTDTPNSVPSTASEKDALAPFLEPDANHQPVLAAIQDAKHSIEMEIYLLTDKDVMEALKKAKGRGVDVRLILEVRPSGVGAGNNPALTELAAAQVAIRHGNPSFATSHAKFMVIDNRVALVMSFDHTRDAFTFNRGFGIIDEDPADIAEMSAVFEADWSGSPVDVPSPRLIWGPRDSRAKLTQFIDSATRTLDMELATMRDEDIEQHIIFAVKRGTAVRLIVSPSTTGPDPNGPALKRLAATGVKIRTLRDPFINTHMLVVDAMRGYVGSHEFTEVSLSSSRELGMILTSRRIVNGLQGTFVADWEIAK